MILKEKEKTYKTKIMIIHKKVKRYIQMSFKKVNFCNKCEQNEKSLELLKHIPRYSINK